MLDNLLPLIWETQPERFPLTGTVLDLARGLIVHSHYVERGVREAGYRRPALADPARRLARREVVPAEGVGGEPLVGCFGHMNMNKRIPQLLEGVRAAARSGGPARSCCSSARRPSGSTSTAGSSGSGSAATR